MAVRLSTRGDGLLITDCGNCEGMGCSKCDRGEVFATEADMARHLCDRADEQLEAVGIPLEPGGVRWMLGAAADLIHDYAALGSDATREASAIRVQSTAWIDEPEWAHLRRPVGVRAAVAAGGC